MLEVEWWGINNESQLKLLKILKEEFVHRVGVKEFVLVS